MRMTTFRASALLGALTIAGVSQVSAQSAPPLTQFVSNPANGASALQISTGLAVQSMCSHLAGREGATPSNSDAGLPAPKQDAYLRCNELVQSAAQVNSGQNPGRSLILTGPELLNALQQVSGEEQSTQGALTTRVSTGQFANISGRLNALRFGTQSAAARGRLASLSTSSDAPLSASAYQPDRVIDPNAFRYEALGGNLLKTSWARAQDSDESSLPSLGSTFLAAGDSAGGGAMGPERKFGWFSEGTYNFGDHDQTASEDGFDFDAMSGTLGADYNFGNAVIGASVGYDKYEADFDTNTLVSGGDVEVKGGSGSLFGAWFGNHVSVDAIASYGTLSSDISRRLTIQSNNPACPVACPSQDRTFTGSPDGDYFAAGVSTGFTFDAASWNLAATVSASFRDVKIDSYSENDSGDGGLALAYGEQSVESFRSIVGFSASRSISRNFGIVMPTFRAEWHHEFKDDPRVIQAQYAIEPTLVNKASACVSCFALVADAPESDFGILGAGLSFVFGRRVQAYVYYESLLGVSNYKSNSVALGLRGQF